MPGERSRPYDGWPRGRHERTVGPDPGKQPGPSRTRGGLDAAKRRGPGPPIRPFTGYDRERATYARLKPGLLAAAPGQFVVIVGDECEGPVATFGEAERAGYRRFGLGPLYIKEVLAKDRVYEISRDVF